MLKEAVANGKNRYQRWQRRAAITGEKIVVWEVFVDNGGLGQELLIFDNVEVHIFSIQNGWNFDSRRIIEEFLDKMREERPDHVWFAPLSTKWAQLQECNVAQQGERMENQLKEERRKLERTHVEVSVDVCDIQGRAGRHAYI